MEYVAFFLDENGFLRATEAYYATSTSLDLNIIFRSQFLPVPMFRNVTLKCLTEISAISLGQYPQYEKHIKEMFRDTLKQLEQVLEFVHAATAHHPFHTKIIYEKE